MSLRDQLLAKGLVSKKRAAKLDRESKRDRRNKQGHKRKKKQVDRERAAEQAEQQRAEQERRAAERKARESERAEHEHGHRVRQIVQGNRLGGRGPFRFFHRRPDGRIGHLDVPAAIAANLRLGRAAIAWHDGAAAVITRKGAQKLLEVEPAAVVHFVQSTTGLSDPAEQLFPTRDWEPSLRPHRQPD